MAEKFSQIIVHESTDNYDEDASDDNDDGEDNDS